MHFLHGIILKINPKKLISLVLILFFFVSFPLFADVPNAVTLELKGSIVFDSAQLLKTEINNVSPTTPITVNLRSLGGYSSALMDLLSFVDQHYKNDHWEVSRDVGYYQKEGKWYP
jgi:hypothetical protein